MNVAVNDMERKVTKFGNSLGITMTDAFKRLGINHGDTVKISVEGDEIVIKKSNKVELPAGISDDFMEKLGEVIGQYDETLKGLKDR